MLENSNINMDLLIALKKGLLTPLEQESLKKLISSDETIKKVVGLMETSKLNDYQILNEKFSQKSNTPKFKLRTPKLNYKILLMIGITIVTIIIIAIILYSKIFNAQKNTTNSKLPIEGEVFPNDKINALQNTSSFFKGDTLISSILYEENNLTIAEETPIEENIEKVKIKADTSRNKIISDSIMEHTTIVKIVTNDIQPIKENETKTEILPEKLFIVKNIFSEELSNKKGLFTNKKNKNPTPTSELNKITSKLNSSIKYTKGKLLKGTNGLINVTFTIDKSGSVSKINYQINQNERLEAVVQNALFKLRDLKLNGEYLLSYQIHFNYEVNK